MGNGVSVIDAQTGAYNDLNGALDNYKEKLLNAAKAEAERNRLVNLYETQRELQEKRDSLTSGWTQADYDYANTAFLPPELIGFAEGAHDVTKWFNPVAWLTDAGKAIGNAFAGRTASTQDYIDYQQLQSSLDDVDAKIKESEDAFTSLNAAQAETKKSVGDNADAFNNLSAEAETASESVRTLSSEVKTLSAAFAEQAETGKLSADTTLELIDKGYAQILQIDNETKAVRINAQAYRELMQAKIDARKVEIQTLMSETREELLGTLGGGWGGLSAFGAMASGVQSSNTSASALYDTLKALEAEFAVLDGMDISAIEAGVHGGSSSASGDSYYSKAYTAYKTEADKKMELIKRELEAKKELRDETIKAIDDEIAARKRLNEDNNMEKQINEVKAQLKYGQLDEFSREQLNKKLQDLYDQKAETQWQRDVQARKDAANATYESQQKIYNAQIDSINQSLQTVQQIMSAMADGSKSVESIINNNNTRNNTANIKVVGQAFTLAQLTKAIKDSLMDDIVIK